MSDVEVYCSGVTARGKGCRNHSRWQAGWTQDAQGFWYCQQHTKQARRAHLKVVK